MKLHDILSARLPEIGDSVKECVNLGEWLLFKTEALAGHPKAAFYLKTDDCIFELDDSGRLLQEVTEDADKLEIDELFYFADISRPTSLSNTRL
ncbi:MAG TPA: hypothetical protein VES70_08320 [Pseudomonas sp.]|nr:hypothetical protein [Pseudomonas sp.]